MTPWACAGCAHERCRPIQGESNELVVLPQKNGARADYSCKKMQAMCSAAICRTRERIRQRRNHLAQDSRNRECRSDRQSGQYDRTSELVKTSLSNLETP